MSFSNESHPNPRIQSVITHEPQITGGSSPEGDDHSNPNKKNRFTRRQRLGAWAAGIALAAGAAVGVGVAASHNSGEAAPKAVESSAPADPSQSPEASKTSTPETSSNVNLTPENVVLGYLFEKLTPDQQAEIKKMNDMSVEEFRALPYDEQFQFGQFVYDNNIDVLKSRLDYNEQSDAYQNIDTSTPEGIVKAGDLQVSLLSSLTTFSDTDGIAFDSITARKAASILQTQPDPVSASAIFKNIDAEIGTWNVNTPIAIPSDTVTGSEINNKGDHIINTHDNNSGLDFQTTYRSVEMTKIDGTKVTTMENIFSVPSTDSRYIPLSK